MFQEEYELYGDLINDIRNIMMEYFEYWGDDSLFYLRRGGRYAEHEFNIEIADGIIFTGKIDAIAKIILLDKEMSFWIGNYSEKSKKP